MRMVARLGVIQAVVVLSSFVTVLGQTPARPGAEDEAAIRRVLSQQVAAWNGRNLEEFMDGYWKSPELTFFSGGRKVKGWEATLERYRKNYQSEGREMGQLAFSELDVLLLGRQAAVVRGRFELTLKDGKKPTGIFTLVFRKFGRQWKVVHDHTSAE